MSTIFVLGLALTAAAQNTTNSQSDLQTQVDQAQNLAKIAQAQADIATANQQKAEAQADAFKAKLGSIDTSDAPKRTITTDSVVIEANYLAYTAANSAAARIADALGEGVCSQNLAFYTGKDQDAVQAYIALKNQLNLVAQAVNGKRMIEPVVLRPVPSSVLPNPEGELVKLYKFESPAPANTQPPPPKQGAQNEPNVTAIATPADASAIINAALGLISLFRVDTTFTGISVASDDVALQALLAHEIQRHCHRFNPQPQLFHPTFSYSTAGSSDLIKQIQSLLDTSEVLKAQAAQLDQFVGTPLGNAITATAKTRDSIAALDADLNTVVAELGSKPFSSDRAKLIKQQTDDTAQRQTLVGQLRNDADACGFPNARTADVATLSAELIGRYQADQVVAQGASAPIQTTASRISDLLSAVSKPGSDGTSPISAILRAERLQKGLTDQSYMLMTKIVSIGGNNINKRNFFWSTLSFSGGIVAEYLLNNKDGAMVQSGTVECYGGRVKEGNFKPGVNPSNSISCSGVNISTQTAQTAQGTAPKAYAGR